MNRACSSEPVSWLQLEQYHLGELPEPSRSAVRGHLEACDTCRACLEQIAGDSPALRPLTAARAPATASVLPLRRGPARLRRWAAGPLLAIAAGALALILIPRGPEGEGTPRHGLKGDAVAIGLVRDRGGAISQDPRTYAARDRFKLLVTCPAGEAREVEVFVVQGMEVSFPFPEPVRVTCGNLVSIPGAFELDGGSPASVCVLSGPELLDRTTLARVSAGGLPEGAICRTLGAE